MQYNASMPAVTYDDCDKSRIRPRHRTIGYQTGESVCACLCWHCITNATTQEPGTCLSFNNPAFFLWAPGFSRHRDNHSSALMAFSSKKQKRRKSWCPGAHVRVRLVAAAGPSVEDQCLILGSLLSSSGEIRDKRTCETRPNRTFEIHQVRP